MRTRVVCWLIGTLLVGVVCTSPLFAGTTVTVTAPKGFADGLHRVALVVDQCVPEVDCSDVGRRATATIVAELKLPLSFVSEAQVREALFKMGATSYSKERRADLATALSADAILEIDIPFAERGDGYGGRQGSEAKVEVRLVKASGEILMSGSGLGRPTNVVTSPERVADRTIKEILQKAFK